MSSQARRIQKTLAQLAAEGEGTDQIADIALGTWRAVEDALSPIIGPRGVAALYQRSLHLTRDAFPWLTLVKQDAFAPDGFIALRAAMVQQVASEAAAAHGALLATFHDLLTKLIGRSLTERLLANIWDNTSDGGDVQDISL